MLSLTKRAKNWIFENFDQILLTVTLTLNLNSDSTQLRTWSLSYLNLFRTFPLNLSAAAY